MNRSRGRVGREEDDKEGEEKKSVGEKQREGSRGGKEDDEI